MKTKKFWNWKKVKNQETGAEERVLELSGTIAEDSWFDDDVTPQLFKDELNAGSGDITVWINSPGGDCVAAAQIYNMLSNYKGRVTVKIDGIAASAASVIAMAGDTVLVSPVSMLMIHNPATIAWGDHAEMQKAMDMLSEVKEEDGEGDTDGEEKKSPSAHSPMLFSRRAADNALLNKVIARYGEKKPKAGIGEQAKIPAPGEKGAPKTETGRSVDALMERLNLLKR